MDAIPYPTDPETTRRLATEAFEKMAGVRIVAREPDFLRAECRSKWLRFVDDLELAFDDEAAVIHFRSGASCPW